MPMKLGGYAKPYSDDNWFRGPGSHKSNGSPALTSGHRAGVVPPRSARIRGIPSLVISCESIQYSRPFSEVP